MALLVLLCACSSPTLDDYREESMGIVKSLVHRLKKIYSYEQLVESAPHLRNQFSRLAYLTVKVNALRKHLEEEPSELSDYERELNDRLRVELMRVCTIKGGRELLESCQEEGYQILQKS